MSNHPRRAVHIAADVFEGFVANLSAHEPAELDDTCRLNCFAAACADVAMVRVARRHHVRADDRTYVNRTFVSRRDGQLRLELDLHGLAHEGLDAAEIIAEANRLAASGLEAFFANGARPKI